MKTFLTFLVTLFAVFSALAQPVRLNWATTNISTTVTQIVSGIPSRVATNLASGGMITNGHVIGSLTASNLTGVGTGTLNQTNTQITAKNQSFIVRTADGNTQLKVALTGGVEATDISALSVAGNGEALTNLNGGYIQLNTINSNKLDAATLALLGGGGSALSTNYVMEYWGAVREDGLPGDGSLWNPFDLSTQAKFDAVWPDALPEYSVLNLQGGQFQTMGVSQFQTTNLVKTGQVLNGSGMYQTTLVFIGATNAGLYSVVQSDYGFANVKISNLTIDCSPAGVMSTNVCVNGVVLRGSGSMIENVRVIHAGSRDIAMESFALAMNNTDGPSTNNVIQGCVVELPIANPSGPATAIAVLGAATNTPSASNSEQFGGVVQNCYVDGGIYRQAADYNGIGAGSSPGVIRNNLILNTGNAVYNDTLAINTLIVEGNYFRNNQHALAFPLEEGGSLGITNRLLDTLIFRNNTVQFGPGATPTSTYGVGIFGQENSTTNIGNVIIQDNVFFDDADNPEAIDNIEFIVRVRNATQVVISGNISRFGHLAEGHWPYQVGNVTRPYSFLNRNYDGVRVATSNIITGELIDEMPVTATSAGGWTKYGDTVSSNDFGLSITDGGNLAGIGNAWVTNWIYNAQTLQPAIDFDPDANQIRSEDGSIVATFSTTQGRTGLNSPNGASSINLSNSGVIGIVGTIQGTGAGGGYLDMQNSGGTTTIVLNAESGEITATLFTGSAAGLTDLNTTGAVSRVSGHLAQPFNVTNTVMAVISDSLGYSWPGIMTNMAQWRGLLAFTNGTEGGTSVVDHTNNWVTRIRPWITNFPSTVTKVLVDAGFTIDQLNGIGLVGGITNYVNVRSNMYREAKNYGIIVVRPSGVMVELAGSTYATDADNNNLWIWNNWLARAPTNIVDFVPDFFRLLPDNTDTNQVGGSISGGFWEETTHPAVRSTYLMAQVVDECLRGVTASHPLPFTGPERLGDRWEFRNPTNGILRAKLWDREQASNGGGAFQHLRASLDGRFPESSLSSAIPLQAVAGVNGNQPAANFLGVNGQTEAVVTVSPYNGGPAVSLWAQGHVLLTGMVRFNDASASSPGLKGVGNTLQVRLADNSDWTALQAGALGVLGLTNTGPSFFTNVAGAGHTFIQGSTIISTNRSTGFSVYITNGNVFADGDISALTFTDRSKAPASLKDAYAIVSSMKSKNGHVDHDALSPLAWGTRTRQIQTGKTIKQLIEPDKSGRDLGMVISAEAMVIQDLLRRLEKLEKK